MKVKKKRQNTDLALLASEICCRPFNGITRPLTLLVQLETKFHLKVSLKYHELNYKENVQTRHLLSDNRFVIAIISNL